MTDKLRNVLSGGLRRTVLETVLSDRRRTALSCSRTSLPT